MNVVSEENRVENNLYKSKFAIVNSGTEIIYMCRDVFLAVYSMLQTKELSEPLKLRNQMLFHLTHFKKKCRIAGYSDVAINDALYAIVSLIDEKVLSIPGDCRHFWLTNPLQLHLFNNVIAGEEFYVRLEKLLASPKLNTDILKVYYLCLSLGFEGKFKLYNCQERQKIIKKLSYLFSDTHGNTEFHVTVENVNQGEKTEKIEKVLIYLSLILSVIFAFEFIAVKFLIMVKENEIINQLRNTIR